MNKKNTENGKEKRYIVKFKRRKVIFEEKDT